MLCWIVSDGVHTLVALYGPNDDSPGFFKSVFSLAQDFDNNNVIMVGDWNVTLHPHIDCDRYVSLGNRRARGVILEFMEQEDVTDIWRGQHAAKRSFTWRRSTPLKQARLDFFSAPIVRKVKGSDILPGYRSDHSLICLVLHERAQNNRGAFWKFNNSLLRDSIFIDLVKKEIKEAKAQYAVPLYTSNELDENNDIELVIDDQLFFEVLLCKIRGLTIAFGARKKRERDKREKALLWQMHIVEGFFVESERCRQRLSSLHQELTELRQVRLAGVAQRAAGYSRARHLPSTFAD